MYVFSYSVSPAATNDRAEWRLLPTVVFQEFSNEERCRAAKSTLEGSLKGAGAKLKSGLEDFEGGRCRRHRAVEEHPTGTEPLPPATFTVLMEKPVQTNVHIVAGIEAATQSETITTNVLDFWLVVFLAVSE
jgi:hypothetical protein